MSEGHAEPAARGAGALAARALVDALGDSHWDGRRLFLTDLHGMRPAEVFADLITMAATTVNIALGDAEPMTLQGIPLPRGTLIPYLVTTPGDPTSDNSGAPGFAATLRTQFLWGSEDPRVLLVLADRPDETITTASDDAASLPELGFPELLKRVAAEQLGAQPAPGSLLSAVIADLGGRPVGTSGRSRLEAFEALLAHGAADDRSLGTDLWRLGEYLSDPEATPRRLSESRKWRSKIEAARRNPAKSLHAHLVAKRVTGQGAAKVAAALGPTGIDWSQFQLSDLQHEGQHPAVELDRHEPVAGARLAFLGVGGSVVAWMPAAGGTVTFALNRELQPGERVRLRWQGTRHAVPGSSSGAAVSFAMTPVGGPHRWRFGSLLLPDGAGGEGEPVALAFTFRDGDIEAFEDGLSPDPTSGAFLCGEQPILRSWNSSGRDLGLARIDEPEPGDEDAAQGSEATQLVCGTAPNGERVGPVPVLAQRSSADSADDYGQDAAGEPGAEGPETGGTPGEGVEDEAEGPTDPLLDPASTAEDVATESRDLADHPSFPNANYALGVTGWPQAGVNEDGELSAKIGSRRVRIRPRLDGLDETARDFLLEVERATHCRPDWAHYAVDVSRGAACLAALPEPEPAWTGEMSAFRRARAAYFAAAEAAGSAYAVDPCSDVATDYVDSYAALLWALPRAGMHRSEYYLLVTLDAVEVKGTRDLLISPMSPLSVAFHASLRRRLEAATEGRDPLQDSDLSAFSLQWTVPVLNHRGAWYEAVPCDRAQLWRRYELLDEAAQASSSTRNAQFIANRIAFFLSVHPNLNSPDNRISVTFVSPGDGRAAIDALKRLMSTEVAEEAYRRPQLEVLLAGATVEVHDALAELTSGLEDPEVARIVRTRCNIRVTDSPHADGFSHVTFLFRTPGGRSTGPVSMDTRAPSNFAAGLATKPGRVVIPEAEPVFATGVFAIEPGVAAGALERIQYRSLELVGGQGGERLVPGDTRMIRARASGQDLDAWYDCSAWVVHLDRMIGIEAFAEEQASRNILEYEDSADPAAFGYDGITATQHVAPYLAALRRSISDLAVLDEGRGRALMSLLESVSGRWTLQIVKRPLPGVRERVGTACAVDFLTRAQQAVAPRPDEVRALVALEELVPGFKDSGIPARYRHSRAGRGPMCDDLLLVRRPVRRSTRLLAPQHLLDPRAAQGYEVQAASRPVELGEGGRGRIPSLHADDESPPGTRAALVSDSEAVAAGAHLGQHLLQFGVDTRTDAERAVPGRR